MSDLVTNLSGDHFKTGTCQRVSRPLLCLWMNWFLVRFKVWLVIWDFSVEDILSAYLSPIVHGISPSLKYLFQDCCELSLTKILHDPSDDVGWKLFLLLPRMVLCEEVLLQSDKRDQKMGAAFMYANITFSQT